MPNRRTLLTVSKNYLWHEATCDFLHIPTKTLRSDSLPEAKIDVYEDRVRTWFLDYAVGLLHSDSSHGNYSADGDYIALSVALAYIEGVEQYRRGEDRAPSNMDGAWFQDSALRVLPTASEEAIEELWRLARCGLFHSGFTKGRVYLSPFYPTALEKKDGELRINPRLVVESVVEDFRAYVKDLRANLSGELAQNFLKVWNQRWENS